MAFSLKKGVSEIAASRAGFQLAEEMIVDKHMQT
jgi:hypothetical protein